MTLRVVFANRICGLTLMLLAHDCLVLCGELLITRPPCRSHTAWVFAAFGPQ